MVECSFGSTAALDACALNRHVQWGRIDFADYTLHCQCHQAVDDQTSE
jgi:hypothetical protein